MLGKILGSAIGAKIDRKDGDSGTKGALVGWFAPGMVKGVAKVGALAAVGFGVVSLVKRAKKQDTADGG